MLQKNSHRPLRIFTSGKRFLASTIAFLAVTSLHHQANAQTCGNALAATPVIFPISGSKVIVGQTVTITRVGLNSGDPGNCLFRNGEGFLLIPDGTVSRVVTNLNLNPSGSVPPPNSFLNCFGTNSTTAEGICFPYSQTYTVQAADVGRSNAIVLPARGQLTVSQVIPFPGVAGEVVFGAAADVDGFNPSSPASPTGFASGSGSQFLIVVNPGLTITKACDTNCFQYGAPISFHGTICNTGDVTLANITVVDSPSATITFAATTLAGRPFDNASGLTNGECVNYFGVYTPTSNLCGPFPDTVVVSGVASGVFNNPVFYATNSTVCTVCNNPGISVVKACPVDLIQPGGLLTFSGVVSNTGNVPLTNVLVFNNQPGPGTLVFGPISLGVHESANFTNSYTVPLDSCGPYTDTLTARGDVFCGGSVTNTDTKSCPGTNSPAIVVTKACPPGLLQPGQTNFITGTVTNIGNITLTNVTVTNVIAVSGQSRRVLGPITLAPGAGTTFTDNYVIPLDSCGPYADTVIASGADKCFGRVVSNSNTQFCPGTNSPAIVVTKACPPGLLQPGQTNFITGTVTNIGNITLTNVTVTNLIAVSGESRLIFGPVTLAPGAGATFSDSYLIPLDSCGPYADSVTANGADKCFGRIVTSSSTQFCPSTNSPAIVVTKQCPFGLLQPGQTNLVAGTVTNTGNITLTNVTVTNVISVLGQTRRVFGPVTLAPGAGASFFDTYVIPLDSCGPYADTFTASGADKCFGRAVTNSNTQFCAGTNSPSIAVTKLCPPGLLQPGQTNVITGTVTNTGNITLTNVTVTNMIAAIGQSRRLIGPITLAPGAGATFTDSYVIPLDSCGPYADTVVGSGADKCFGRVVTNSNTQFCPGTNSPAIAVSKACPANPVPPGGLMVISGTVSNSGNITLTNVTVTNVIAAIGQSHLVFGPASLAPGQVAEFTDSYNVPLNSCGPYRDTVLARGADKCFGRIVTANDFKDCPGITTPRIAVIKHCPANPVPPGGVAVFSGTVSNAGNITLTNVFVVNNRPTNNTPVIGPITLLPGQATNFTGSEVVPLNCCTYFDTLLATGTSICTGSNVVASATATCPTITTPRMTLAKFCPPSPVPLGQTLVYSGIVSNSGNIALINVMVVDNKPTNNTPVLGPISLAPGEYTTFSGSYAVPINICDTNITDTAFAQANDICTGSNVTASATAMCPIVPTPRLSLTKHCPPNPVAPGDLLVYTGTISNSGTITITNVFVVDDRPLPNTPVLGPITLIPGQAIGFSGSYIAPYDCCGPCVDTLTARGNEICLGSNVVASASAACPRITTPRIAVTRDCPPAPVTAGDLVFFTGVVTNSGNATLNNVLVVDDEAGVVLDNIALAPGESVPYMGMYIPTNCGPNTASAVTVTASDVCTGIVVSNRFVASCSITCTTSQPLVLYGEGFSGGIFVFSFDTELNQSYKVQVSDSVPSTNWLTITNVLGTGSTITIPDVGPTSQRFYRVMIDQ